PPSTIRAGARRRNGGSPAMVPTACSPNAFPHFRSTATPTRWRRCTRAWTSSAGTERPMASPRRYTLLAAKTVLHALALAPLAVLCWRFRLAYSGLDPQALGADPVAEIEHELGIWALRLLLATLAITPLRQLTGQSG